MKKFILSLLLLSCFSKNDYAQQWYHTSQPFYNRDINDLQIFNHNSVFLAGGLDPSTRSFYSSKNYGASWDILYDNYAPTVKSVAFHDTLNGFAAGYSGTLLHTIDGGANWTDITPPVIADFNKIVYADTQTLFVAGGNPNNDTLQVILKSSDNGNNWNTIFSQPGALLKSVYFINTLHGIAVGDSGTILKTINGGSSWVTIATPVQRNFNAVTFTNDTTGYIAGGKEANDSVRTILKTTDGGSNWSIIKDEPGAWLRDIIFISHDTGYSVGDKASLYITTDAGQNWNQQPVNGATGDESFNVIRFYDAEFGFIGAKAGNVFIYTTATLPELYTWGSSLEDSAKADIKAFVNTHNVPAIYAFYYSLDSSLTSYAETFQKSFVSDSLLPVHEPIGGLTPNTTYYYCAVLRTFSGTVYGDTLSFFTGTLPFVFQTNNPTDITDSTAILRGTIDQFPVPANLFFEYGTSPAFGNEVPAIPSSVNDTMNHWIYLPINGLQAGLTYYYRLKGVGASRTYYGENRYFYTGKPYSVFETHTAMVTSDTSVNFHGIVHGFLYPVTLSFEYGTTPAMTQETPNSFYHDTAYFSFWNSAYQLFPNTLYYFRLKGVTSMGVFYGSTLTFYTGSGSSGFQTLLASQVTSISAQLNGQANKLLLPTDFSFEYGTSWALGNVIAGNPNTVNDTLLHPISAVLSGLLPNTVYYYRLKGSIVAGLNFYGDIKQLYTADCEIPNCDFEIWDTTIMESPTGWFVEGDIHRVPSYNGTNAAEFRGGPSSHLGAIIFGIKQGSNGLTPGYPFPVRPDSIKFYARYNIASGDTGYLGVFFGLHGSIINQQVFPITGNTSGNFILKKYKITFPTSDVPDSMGLIFISSNGFSADPPNMSNPNSILAIDNVSFAGTNLTLPNSDFELWETLASDKPQSWSYSDELLSPGYDALEKVTDRFSGNYAARIHNDLSETTKAAFIKSGAGDGYNHPTFAVAARHSTLNGYIKYLPQNGDTLSIYVAMYLHGVKIGMAGLLIDTAINGYTPFTANIDYLNPGGTDIPDSADLTISLGVINPHGNSIAYIDNVSFDGFRFVGIKEHDLVETSGEILCNVYPNPARSNLIVELNGFAGKVIYTVTDIAGRHLLSTNDNIERPGITIKSLNVSAWPMGIYLLKVSSNGVTATRKFVIEN